MYLYERHWPAGMSELSIELSCFRSGLSEKDGGRGKFGHFKRIVEIQWPATNRRKGFIWHPWAEKMLLEACEQQYLSVSGPAGCGKSDSFAVWALVQWECDPINTKVIVTSTTLSGSRKRIWGSLTDYYMAAADHMPGKLVDSIGIIRTEDEEYGVKASTKSGIELIAGDKTKDAERENIGKLIGIHNERVILIGDEMPELSENLIKAAKSNLSANPYFQFIGIGNPLSRYDPHGQFSEPAAGWPSIDEHSTEWETKAGKAIRFDGEQSPNILSGKTIYKFLPTVADMEQARKDMGPDSLGYWRMFRGFWCPEGTESQSIYSEVEINEAGATGEDVEWHGTPIPVSACDAAWGPHGDQTVAVFGLFGRSASGQDVLLVTDTINLKEKKSVQKERMFQIVEQYMRECMKRGVVPANIAYDATGGGAVFGDIMVQLWKDRSFHKVNFADIASDIPVFSAGKMQPANELFADRVSELWFVAKDFLRSKQIYGLTPNIINDMTARREDSTKRGSGAGKRAVEAKVKMKKRIKRSPDWGDAFFLLCDLCRFRHKWRAGVAKQANKLATDAWRRTKDTLESEDAPALPRTLLPVGEIEEQMMGARRSWLDEKELEYPDPFSEL